MKRNENGVINLFKKKSADSTATTANDVQVVSNCAKMVKHGWDIGKILRYFVRYLMSRLLAAMYIYVKRHPKYFQ